MQVNISNVRERLEKTRGICRMILARGRGTNQNIDSSPEVVYCTSEG